MEFVIGIRPPVDIVLHLLSGQSNTLLHASQLQLLCLCRQSTKLLQLILLAGERRQRFDHFGQCLETVSVAAKIVKLLNLPLSPLIPPLHSLFRNLLNMRRQKVKCQLKPNHILRNSRKSSSAVLFCNSELRGQSHVQVSANEIISISLSVPIPNFKDLLGQQPRFLGTPHSSQQSFPFRCTGRLQILLMRKLPFWQSSLAHCHAINDVLQVRLNSATKFTLIDIQSSPSLPPLTCSHPASSSTLGTAPVPYSCSDRIRNRRQT